MSDTRTIELTLHLNNTPEAVMGYIADVRNRPAYIPHLKEVSGIEGEPTAAGTRWKWTFSMLGLEFHGTAYCQESIPGRRYVTVTEGGIRSTWTYEAQPADGGTDLTVRLEYEVPERAFSVLPTDRVVEGMRTAEADRLIQNLKGVLDR